MEQSEGTVAGRWQRLPVSSCQKQRAAVSCVQDGGNVSLLQRWKIQSMAGAGDSSLVPNSHEESPCRFCNFAFW